MRGTNASVGRARAREEVIRDARATRRFFASSNDDGHETSREMTLCKRRLVDDVSGRPRHSARARGRGATVASAMRVEHAAAFGVGVAAAAYALWRVSSSRESVVKRAWLGIVVARHPESSSSRERDRVAAEPDPPDGVPADYLCPIGGHVMLDPVLCGCSPSCGKSFDRRSIERWILEGSPSCPVTSRPLDLDKLYPNRTPRSAVETHPAENDVPADVMPPPSFEDSPEAESFPPRRPSRRRRRTRTRARRADARVDRTSPRRSRRRGRRRRSRRGASKTRVRRDGDAQSARDGGEKARRRRREQYPREQHRRASPSERLSRDALRRRTTRVLLAAGAVEALLDLVRAADGGAKIHPPGRLRRFRVRSRFLPPRERERRP